MSKKLKSKNNSHILRTFPNLEFLKIFLMSHDLDIFVNRLITLKDCTIDAKKKKSKSKNTKKLARV